MIKFDSSLLSFEIIRLKAVTTALGGSISIIDEAKSSATKEVTQRVEVPMAVARAFIQATKKVTKYLKPVYTALVIYDGRVISMERHPLAALGKLVDEGAFGQRKWEPASMTNWRQTILPRIAAHNTTDWYFDGRYVYTLRDGEYHNALAQATNMSADGRFRKVIAMSIDMQDMTAVEDLEPRERSCLAFVASNGASAISPPIWKNLDAVGSTQLSRSSSDDDDDDATEGVVQASNTFDDIDFELSVNLNFALKAGNEIGKVFGYEYVEPLNLPQMMIEMKTVNLPSLKKEIKATYDIGMTFTQAMAWLLGLSRKANNMETHLMMRSLMKYLSSKGMFRRKAFDAENVFRANKTVDDLPVVNLAELRDMSSYDDLDLALMMQRGRSGQDIVTGVTLD